MSYIGENELLNFYSGECVAVSDKALGTVETAYLGRLLASRYDILCIGSEEFRHNSLLYVLAGALAECGTEVYICENTDPASFRFSISLLGAEAGVFIADSRRMYIYSNYGSILCDKELSEVKNAVPAEKSVKTGSIHHYTSFRSIYTANIRKNTDTGDKKLPCAISCGNAGIRSLWGEFFDNEDREMSLQISDSGLIVNAYSAMHGFIPYEKLILAYMTVFKEVGQAVYLPESFHYAADMLDDIRVIRYKSSDIPPVPAQKQRFPRDALFMCTRLMSDRAKFSTVINSLPDMASVKRDVTVDSHRPINIYRSISAPNGRIFVTQSGRSRLRIAAQAANMETASELCAEWFEKIRRSGTEGFDDIALQ